MKKKFNGIIVIVAIIGLIIAACGDSTTGDPTSPALLLTEGPPAIATTNLPDGAIGVAYNKVLAAAGANPKEWSMANGNLPNGLSLDESAGIISGIPEAAGEFSFSIGVSNSEGYDEKDFIVKITGAAPVYSISASPLSSFGSLQSPYTQPAAQTVTVTNTGTGTVTPTNYGPQGLVNSMNNDVAFYDKDSGKGRVIIEAHFTTRFNSGVTVISYNTRVEVLQTSFLVLDSAENCNITFTAIKLERY